MTSDDENGNDDGIERRVIETLIDLREERGWSQSELARRMVEAGWPKYTQMTVSRTEKGERPIRLNEAETLAEVFGVELFELWLPRRIRLFHSTSENVDRLAAQLEELIERYLKESKKLAVRADNSDLGEEEIGYVAAQLMETPEVIAAKVRASTDSDFERLLDRVKGPSKSARETTSEERFWGEPESERRLLKLFWDINGKHPEAV